MVRRQFIKLLGLSSLLPKVILDLLTTSTKVAPGLSSARIIGCKKTIFNSVDYGVITPLSGQGVSGDNILEGNEESLSFF